MNQIRKTSMTVFAAFFFFACSHKPKPLPPVPAFDKVNGQPTANADAGRGRSEGFVSSPKYPTVYFDFDSDRIRDEDQQRLSNVIRDANVNWVCHVDGFASSEGADDYNLALGSRRASRVGDYISAAKGVTVVEVSYGEERQAVTPELSRRVEIRCE